MSSMPRKMRPLISLIYMKKRFNYGIRLSDLMVIYMFELDNTRVVHPLEQFCFAFELVDVRLGQVLPPDDLSNS